MSKLPTVLLVCLFFTASLCAETSAIKDIFLPGAPIRNFRIPVFGEKGTRKWYFQGEEGVFRSESKLNVTQMLIKTFDEFPPYALQSYMSSPKATILVQDEQAYSDQPIKLKSLKFTLTGSHWNWNGKTSSMSIHKDVKLTFNLSLANLLESTP